jgi:hypothetical protein
MGDGDVISTLSLIAYGGLPLCAVVLVPSSSQALQIPQLVYRPLAGKEFMALHALYRKGDV